MTVRLFTAALALLAAAPAFAQRTADLNASPTPLAARLAALRGETSAAPSAAPAAAAARVAPGATADLELFVSTSAPTLSVGETVTVSVHVANRGLATAPDVQIAGPISAASLPSGLRLTAASSETGAFDADKGLWYIGELAPEQEAWLYIDFLVVTPGQYAFLSEVASAGIDDADSTPYNGADGEDDIGSAGFTASP